MYHWEVIDAFFRENPLVKQHIDSYNEFVNNKIHKIIEELGEIATEKEGCSIRLHKIRLEKPVVIEADGSRRNIMPIEARIRNRSYATPVYLEMTLLLDNVETEREEVHIGDLPVMLRSDICHLNGLSRDELIERGEDPDDPGGYFIINGSERVLVSVEEIAPNRVIVCKETKSSKEIIIGRISSEKAGFKAKISIERNQDGLVYVTFPTSPKNLNLFVVLKALGLDSKNKLMETFSDRQDIANDILLNLEGIEAKTANEALDYLGKRLAAGQPEEYRKSRAEHILDNYLLPHIGLQKEDRIKKAYFLARIAERCIEVAYGNREEDDKDHYANKRVKISGELMDKLFRYAMGYFIKDVKYQVERAHIRRRKLQIQTLVRPNALSDRIRFAMATGTWVGGRQGISQLLDRINYMSLLSHLRRVISPLSKTQPHFEARDLHPTHFGKICPNETPEGQSCGLVKNLAIGCLISSHKAEGMEDNLSKLGVSLIKK